MPRTVVVVGDALLDVDVTGTVGRTVPDSDAPVFDETDRSERPGGAALAALLAASDADTEVHLVTALPEDAAAAAVRAHLRERAGDRTRVTTLPATGAIGVKTRLRTKDAVVARHDTGGSALEVTDVPDAVTRVLCSADAVLVSDYGRGVAAAPGVTAALDAAVAAGRPVVWDPHPRGPRPVRGAALVTPNAAEAAGALGADAASGATAASAQAEALARLWDARAVVVTLGERGGVLARPDAPPVVVASPESVTGDACGAGDRFASRAATALAAGASVDDAVRAAVAGATGFVAAGGVAALGVHPFPDDPLPALTQRLADTRRRGGTVVATGGCFDLLHAGHVAVLEAARGLGDVLVVCLNSDDSVRRAKGEGRPLQPAEDRARVLSALRGVDGVVVFDEDTPEELLRRLRPDVWVKGGDYRADDLPETPLVRSWGGEVVIVPYLAERSTTRLVELARR